MTDASNGTTFLYTDDIEDAFRKVRDIQEHVREYVLSPRLPVSVDDIISAISEKYEWQIDIELVDFEAVHIRGMIERYEDGRAQVYVRATQADNSDDNVFWHRFITVKEASHIAIDEEEDWSPDGVETIKEIIKDHRNESAGVPTSEVQSEHLAEIVALELLYPHEFRQKDIESGKSARELANEYQIPVYVVERAISQNHMKIASVVWSFVGGHGLGGIGSNPEGEV